MSIYNKVKSQNPDHWDQRIQNPGPMKPPSAGGTTQHSSLPGKNNTSFTAAEWSQLFNVALQKAQAAGNEKAVGMIKAYQASLKKEPEKWESITLPKINPNNGLQSQNTAYGFGGPFWQQGQGQGGSPFQTRYGATPGGSLQDRLVDGGGHGGRMMGANRAGGTPGLISNNDWVINALASGWTSEPPPSMSAAEANIWSQLYDPEGYYQWDWNPGGTLSPTASFEDWTKNPYLAEYDKIAQHNAWNQYAESHLPTLSEFGY